MGSVGGPTKIHSGRLLYYTRRIVTCILGMARLERAEGVVQDMRHRNSMRVLAAVAAGLAAPMLWSGAEAAEAEIRSFSFGWRDARRAHRQAPARRYRRRHVHEPPRATCAVPGYHRPQDRAVLGERPVRDRGGDPAVRRLSARVPRPGASMRRALLVRALQVRHRGPSAGRRRCERGGRGRAPAGDHAGRRAQGQAG